MFQVWYGWRKVTIEFRKRLDPDLPFYYYTSAHSRYYDDVLPSFNTKSTGKQRSIRRAPQRELLTSSHRVTMTVRGSKSLRTTFHNLPVDLPPPPNALNAHVRSEHSYA